MRLSAFTHRLANRQVGGKATGHDHAVLDDGAVVGLVRDGIDVLKRFSAELEECSKVEKEPSREARNRINMILAPK